MTLRTFFLIGITLAIAGCTKKEAPPPPAQENVPAAAEEAAPMGEPMATPKVSAGTDAFIEHMHEHAKQLGRINIALESGDRYCQRSGYRRSARCGSEGRGGLHRLSLGRRCVCA